MRVHRTAYTAGNVSTRGLRQIACARLLVTLARLTHRRSRSVRVGLLIAILASPGALITAAPARADIIYDPTSVSIGNGIQLVNGTYLNAQKIADKLVNTSIEIQATASITIVDPSDISTSPLGAPRFDLTLSAPVCNVDNNINLAASGNLILTCGTLNLNAQITSGGTTIDPNRVTSTATHVNVLSNAASLQQAIDSSSSTSPVVHVSPGQYVENLTIRHALTLAGNDGTSAAGANPNAPTLVGTQPAGNVITVNANNVTVDGLHLNGTVAGGLSASSVDGIFANGVDALTVTHNTFDGFSGLSIAPPGSTNVVSDANDTVIDPISVSIGNGTEQVNGTYLNAKNVTDSLVFTSINIQASASITIVDPIDLSTSVYGIPVFTLFLTAPVCNIDNGVNMAAIGGSRLSLSCTTLNLNAQITSGGTTIDPSRVISTATQVNVLSNAASIQQAMDDSSTTAPVVVQVARAQYAENLTINKSLTLTGNDGTSATGADPNAPTLVGTQPAGNVITVNANNVQIDGLHLNGTVAGGSSASSVDGIFASGVDGLTVTHNTFDGFSGFSIAAPGSTNVVLSANGPIDTVMFNSEGGSAVGSLSGLNGTITLPAAPSLAGYSFAGWNTASDGSGIAYADGATYLLAGSTTLYAQWTASASSIYPVITSASYVDAGVSLTFTAPTVAAGSTITSYDFQASTDGGTTVVGTGNTASYVGSYGNTTATSSPQTDPNAAAWCGQNTTCSYRIRAEIDSGASQSSWSTWVTVDPPFTAPALNSATYVDSGVSLAFTAPSVPTGSTITSYDYQASTDGGATVAGTGNTASYVGSYGNTTATSSPQTDPNAAAWCGQNTTCSYRIRAEIGGSTWQTPWSSWVTVAPAFVAPALNSATYVDSGVSLAFTAPSLPTGSTITSYDFQASTDGGTTVVGTGNTASYVGSYGNTTATSSPQTDPNAAAWCGQNTTCSYRIRAEIGAGDTWQIPWSSWVTVAPAFAAPALNSATYVDSGVSLAFTAPSLPTGSTITSYDFQASTDGGTTVVGTGNTASYVGSYGNTTATSSPQTDPNAAAWCGQNTTCSYRIRAEIGAGDTWQTPWSSWVTVGTLNTYTVTFAANGGAGTMAAESDNAPTALTANAFTRAGYTFSAWNSAANGSGTSYADGASYPFTADATLYAQWTANTYTVTFAANGGAGTMAAESHNAPTALTANAFTRAGYTFAGWNTAADGTGSGYADGATYPFTVNATLYAQWTANTYTVTFAANGGAGTMAAESHNAPTALTANAFTRAGYTFAGWNTAADGTGSGYADGATYPFTANATLYAQWTANTYTVTFAANGGAGTMAAESHNAPTALTANAFTRAGYTFAGWNTAADGTGSGYADGATYPFTANATLYAQWTANTYTVTFAANGGAGTMAAESHNAPTALTANAFTRAGYTFAGWNTAADGTGSGYADGATYPFTANATLYAQWTANTYTVTFAANGGAGTMAAESHNAPTALTANAFTRAGYTFAGWNTAADGTGSGYADGATYPFTANATLYAQWTANTYTVTFAANGGAGTMAAESHNAPTALTANAFTRAGYTFAGWNTAADGTGSGYADGATYPFTANATLYAQWTANTYTVTFAANGGAGTMAAESHNAPTALTANAFTRAGYTFAGWNTAADGTGSGYADGATYPFTVNATLYAQWTANTYTVTFAANGGAGTMAAESHNAPTALTANAFTRAGYTFAGWNTAADGTGSGYADGATYPFTVNATLYAQWTANTYTVTFAANGGAGTMAAESHNAPTALTANAFTRAGYTFAGWNTAADGTGSGYADGATYPFTASVTLYAQWTANTYTVTYSANGATAGTVPVDASSPYVSGATVTVLANSGLLAKTGSSFAGWNTAAIGGTHYAPGATFAMPAANVVLYAQWTLNTYSVTYSANGATAGTVPVDASSPYVSGATVTVLANTGLLAKTGYSFAGWNTAAIGGTHYAPGATFSMPAASVVLYAQWTLINKLSQTITFGPLANKTLADSPVTVSATASSGLAVTFTTSTPSVCSSGGTNGATITLLKAGTCTVKASQVGNSIYNAATSVSQTFTVTVAADVKLLLYAGGFTSSSHVGVYLAIVANTSTVATSGALTFTDTLPAGLTYDMSLTTLFLAPGWTCGSASQTVTCTYAKSLPALGATSIFVVVRVTAPRGTLLTDTGTVTPLDATPADNTASVKVTVK